MIRRGPSPWLLISIAILIALRLGFAGITELLPEEAYYWTYSQNPAMGYYDHPPMVAWMIGAGTFLFGDTEFGVRFFTIILSAATCGLLFLLGRFWFNDRVASFGALLYAWLPIYAGAGFIVTPDQPLIFFWALALVAFSRAIRHGRWMDWMLGGVAFGGALQSKYYGLLLAPSLVLFLVLSQEHRRWLWRPQMWLALLLGGALFSPVIVWNSQHQWASFLFQSSRTSESNPDALRYVATFWASQAAMLTPLVLALFGLCVWHGVSRIKQQRDDRWNFALSFSLPLFLLFGLASLKTEVRVNWTAPAFLALLPAAASLFFERIDSLAGKGGWWRTGARVTAAVCVGAILLGMVSLAWGAPKLYEHAGAWASTAGAVESAQTDLATETGQKAFVIDTGKYDLAAEVGFYGGESDELVNNYALGKGGLGFRYWTMLDRFEGLPAVAMLERLDESTMRRLRNHFFHVSEPRQIDVKGTGFYRRTIFLANCYDYSEKAISRK